ncbi:MAG: leucine-rich repeat domain-containing protein, partial [Desulfobulbaceae bacterium]|nr:leucine-rich repeat domain-containing protein [Desulfobulbaceae bacterium]
NLDLRWNEIGDLSPLAGLTQLTFLNLGGNHNITNLSPLQNLTNLQFLYLGGNNISDISPLLELNNVTVLDIGYNYISDISILTSLYQLETLNLHYNAIANIDPLSGLEVLYEVWLEGNCIADFTPVNNVELVHGNSATAQDSDVDGACGSADNCLGLYNPEQSDKDNDLVGDACDNCPAAANYDQLNDDNDELGNVCDNCPTDPENICSANAVDGLTVALQTPSQALEVTPGDPIPVQLCQQNPEGTDVYTIFDCFTVTYKISDSSGDVLPTKHKDRVAYMIGTPAAPGDVVTIPAGGELCITCYVEEGVEFPLPEPGDSETFTGDACTTNYITDRDLMPDGTCAAGDGNCFDMKIGTVCAPLTEINMTNRETVNIDIKPGTEPNSINLGSNGKVPVAILSSTLFDATTINPLTVELAGATVAFKGKSDNPMTSIDDVDGDGLPDLIVHIETQGFLLTDGDVKAELVAEAKKSNGDVLYIRGEDSIRVVPDN